MLLQEKACLITGVSSEQGIGFATAELFARYGAKVAILDIQLDAKKAHILSNKIATAIRQKVRSSVTNATFPIMTIASKSSIIRRFVGPWSSISRL